MSEYPRSAVVAVAQGARRGEAESQLYVFSQAAIVALVSWVEARRRNGQETDADEAISEASARGWLTRVSYDPPTLAEE